MFAVCPYFSGLGGLLVVVGVSGRLCSDGQGRLSLGKSYGLGYHVMF